MLTSVNLKNLIEIWNNNPQITKTELMVMWDADGPNVKRWMESAGFRQFRDSDGKWRFTKREEVQEIKEIIPYELSESQRTQLYLKMGHSVCSISVHQNILNSTVYRARDLMEKRKQDPVELKAEPVAAKEETPAPILQKVSETPQEKENRIFELNQHKGKFPELGDKTPHHIDEITQALFFPNGIPKCQACQRDVTYTDIIVRNNAEPKYPDSFIPVDARPKIIMPIPVAYAHMNQWKEFFNFGLTGYKDIDEIRLLEAFTADTIAHVIRQRMGWIAMELLKKRKKNAAKSREEQMSFSYDPPAPTEYDNEGNPIG